MKRDELLLAWLFGVAAGVLMTATLAMLLFARCG